MEDKKCRNWWVMKWFDTRAVALAWEPPAKPKVKYCCWRVHECPTTKRIHAHILFQFATSVRYTSIESKGYNNIKWVKPEDLEKKRGYCIDDYHKKDGTPKGVISAFMEIGQWGSPIATRGNKRSDICREALACNTAEEGLSIIVEKLPYEYLVHGVAMEMNLRKRKFETYIPKYQLTDFNIPPVDFEDKSVLVWGDTDTGKTQYCLAHFKNPLLVRHMDNLKSLRKENDGIVFDDMSFKHTPFDAVKHLLDWDEASSIHCRFHNALIPAKTRKLFTSNEENPFYELNIPSAHALAIERRLKRIHVTDKLF